MPKILEKPFADRVQGSRGLLASVVILGTALVIASWANYRSAREATRALHEGQARVFERAVFGALRRGDRDEPPDYQAVADTLLADYRTEGLRYVALLGADDSASAEAGIPQGELDRPAAEEARYRLVTVGSRVRVSLFRPRSSGGDRPEPPPGEEEDVHRRRDRRPAGVIFEFDPLVATRLVERARGVMLFGLAAAAVMFAVAVVSWNLSRGYERAVRRLEEQRRLSLLGEMSAVLAHEIRNPLASLKGHAQLLAEKLPAGGAEHRKAETVVREATRLEALTADLLDFVRLGPADRAPADPAALVRACVEEVDPEGFGVHVEGTPGRWSLDADRMRQVLVNLLRNARQATPEGAARPEVSVAAAGGVLVIEVRDRGPGLPAGEGERIFDPFFTTRATGTGLGLAVARRIVEHHGGTLAAADRPGGGAVFRIELPEGGA